MFNKYNKVIEAIEPFGLTLIVLAGASQSGWVKFSNQEAVGVVVFGFGILLIINHVVKRLGKK